MINYKKGDKRIKHYEFNYSNKIGEGSYAQVYAGVDLLTIAIKVIENRLLTNDYANKLMHQEINIMKKLHHPNLVELINVYHSANNTYIISEYCNGGDLKQYLKNHKLDEHKAITIFKQILNGLQELLQNDIVHRDIKPANILIHNKSNQEVFKIADFGFAREVAQSTSTMASIVGTPLYMSPQILMNQLYTSKADVWSLGIILYELLYQTTPWPATNFIELINKIQSEPLRFPHKSILSTKTLQILNCCLQIYEDERMSWDELFISFNIIDTQQSPNTCRIIKHNSGHFQLQQSPNKLKLCKTQSNLSSPFRNSPKRSLSSQSFQIKLQQNDQYQNIKQTHQQNQKKLSYLNLFKLMEDQLNILPQDELNEELKQVILKQKLKLINSTKEGVFNKIDEADLVSVQKQLQQTSSNTQLQVMILLISTYRKLVVKNIKTQTLNLNLDEVNNIKNCHIIQQNQK